MLTRARALPARAARSAAAFGLILALVAGWAPAAGAHASLEETTPASGAQLSAAPDEVILNFTEPVSASLGGIRVFDGSGRRIDAGDVTRSSGGTRLSTPVEEAGDGAFAVSWKVLSADSHPIRGAFTFRVGTVSASDEAAAAERVTDGGGASKAVTTVFGVTRAVAFGALAVLVGGVFFIAALWPAGHAAARARHVLWWAWGAAVASTVAGIALQGPYVAGLGLGDALDPSLLDAVLDTRFGRAWGARLLLLLAAGVLLRFLPRASTTAAWRAAATVVAVALLATPGIAGHASSGSLIPAALTVDVAHLVGVSVWLGGLVLLAVAALSGPEVSEAHSISARFSRVALASVIVIVATGTFQSWRQVRSFDALRSTDYGRLLLIKVGVFLGLIALAAVSRQVVRRRLAIPVPAGAAGPGAMRIDADPSPLRRLRLTVAAETAMAVVVIGITAVLVNTVPAREALAKPISTTATGEGLSVEVNVLPAQAGQNTLHVYIFDDKGSTLAVDAFDATLTLPAQDIGPLEVPFERVTPNHFSAYGVDIPIGGAWQLDLIARPTEFDQLKASTTLEIR